MEKPLLVTDFLDRARKYYGDMEAIVATTDESFTYDEFGDRVDRLSTVLQEHGIEKGDRVAVLDPNTHYHLETAYATMQLGGVHTPLNYRLTPDDFEYILNDAGVDAIYADYEYARKVEAVRDEIPTELFITNDADAVDGDWLDFEAVIADVTPDVQRPPMDEDDVITINYTSGTTGDPKGVMRTHRTETLHAYLVTIHHEIQEDDRYLWTLPMFHVNGWGHIYAITGMGATHVCTRGVDIEWVVDRIRNEDISFLCAAPTVLNQLIDYYEDNGQPAMQGDADVRVTTAGSAPPEATVRTVEEDFGWHLKHLYGATETGPLITLSDPKRHGEPGERISLKKRQGLGVLGTDVRVVDEDGNDVPWDDATIGEVVVRGNQVMDGYWNKPEATEEAFNDRVEGYYHMGDLATVDEDGFIALKDRKKDIIISGGENISSIELEDVLFDHDAVADVAVIPAPSEEWGETPKAFVVPAEGDADDPAVAKEELIGFLRERVADFKAVRRMEFVDELPTTATGKIQKYELREREWDDEDGMIGQG